MMVEVFMEMNFIKLSVNGVNSIHMTGTSDLHHNATLNSVVTDRIDFSDKAKNTLELTHGLEIYEKYKSNPLEIPTEQRWQLKDLYDLLVESKEQGHVLDKQTAESRDAAIAQLKGFFDTEEKMGQQRLLTALMDHSLKVLESETKQAEARAEQMKIMTECIKIAAKVSKGSASPEEIQYLQKHGVDMYAMAMALRQPKDDDKNNETTTDIEEHDTDSPKNAVHEVVSVVSTSI